MRRSPPAGCCALCCNQARCLAWFTSNHAPRTSRTACCAVTSTRRTPHAVVAPIGLEAAALGHLPARPPRAAVLPRPPPPPAPLASRLHAPSPDCTHSAHSAAWHLTAITVLRCAARRLALAHGVCRRVASAKDRPGKKTPPAEPSAETAVPAQMWHSPMWRTPGADVADVTRERRRRSGVPMVEQQTTGRGT